MITLAGRRVVAAALLFPDGSIATGRDHFDIVERLLDAPESERVAMLPNVSEGWVDEDGRFMTREEAEPIVIAAGQVSSEYERQEALDGLGTDGLNDEYFDRWH